MKGIPALHILVVLFITLAACSQAVSSPEPASPAGQAVVISPTERITPTIVIETTETPERTELPSPEPTATFSSVTVTPSSSPISLESLKNFTYWLEDLHISAKIQDGVLVSNTRVGKLVEPVAFGDLNGDGQPDAAVILDLRLGEASSYYDLIGLLNQDGKLVQTGFAYIGDGLVVNHLEIANGRIILDGMMPPFYSLNPLCRRTERRLRSYVMDAGVLRLSGEQILDSPTAQAVPLPDEILIESPGLGDPLGTSQPVSGRVSQVPPERKLAYRVTDLLKGLLVQGEVPVQGEPGGPGTFTFQLDLDPGSVGLVRVEIEDSANGLLHGRSMVLLLGKENFGPCQSPFNYEYLKAIGRLHP